MINLEERLKKELQSVKANQYENIEKMEQYFKMKGYIQALEYIIEMLR